MLFLVKRFRTRGRECAYTLGSSEVATDALWHLLTALAGASALSRARWPRRRLQGREARATRSRRVTRWQRWWAFPIGGTCMWRSGSEVSDWVLPRDRGLARRAVR